MRTAVWLATVMFALTVSPLVFPQDRIETVSVTEHRPLAKAIVTLEERYGWLITYEDPRYSYSGDLIDRTRTTSKNPEENYRTGRLDVVPVERTIQFEYPVEANGTPKESMEVVLGKAIASYEQVTGGKFVIRREGGNRLHVVPSRVKDASGQVVPQFSIMDTRISFPTKGRSKLETLDIICEALSQATGVHVGAGGYPINEFVQTNVAAGANNQPARDVLDSVLDQIDPHFSWVLLYSPGLRWYMLSVFRVPPQRR